MTLAAWARRVSLGVGIRKSSGAQSHNCNAGAPSFLKPASNEMTVCLMHVQVFGTNVCGPKTHNVPPEVDLESNKSLAKDAS